MKRYLKYVISSIVLFSMVALLVFCKDKWNKKLEDSQKMETKAVVIGNMCATYEKIDRELTMDYFYDLDNNTTYQQVESEIGKPNGGMGSGLVKPYYQVGDQYVVMWFSLTEEGEYDKLLRMCQYTNEEYLNDIPLK